jgi:hypothetical protein
MKPTPPHDARATRRARRFALGVGVLAPMAMAVVVVACSRSWL